MNANQRRIFLLNVTTVTSGLVTSFFLPWQSTASLLNSEQNSFAYGHQYYSRMLTIKESIRLTEVECHRRYFQPHGREPEKRRQCVDAGSGRAHGLY